METVQIRFQYLYVCIFPGATAIYMSPRKQPDRMDDNDAEGGGKQQEYMAVMSPNGKSVFHIPIIYTEEVTTEQAAAPGSLSSTMPRTSTLSSTGQVSSNPSSGDTVTSDDVMGIVICSLIRTCLLLNRRCLMTRWQMRGNAIGASLNFQLSYARERVDI